MKVVLTLVIVGIIGFIGIMAFNIGNIKMADAFGSFGHRDSTESMHNNDRYNNHESGDGYHKNGAGMEAMAEVLGLTIEELEDAMNEYMHSSGGMYFENSEFLEERAAALGITVEELVTNIDEVRDEYMGGCGNHTGGHRSMHN